MADSQNHNNKPPASSDSSRVPGQIGDQNHHHRFRNPPETSIPDPATLRDQWRFAIRQYSRWYSQAWGTAILAGLSFFALGWVIKGGNPLPSLSNKAEHSNREPSGGGGDSGSDTPSPPVPPILSPSPADAHQTPKS